MSHLDEVRQKYPQYNDWSDEELAEGLYEKHYSDMSPSDYYKQIGLPNPHAGFKGVGEDIVSGLKGAFPKAGEVIGATAKGLYDIGGGNAPAPKTLADYLRFAVGIPTEAEKEHGYSPERFGRVAVASALKGARGLLNVPGNMLDYAKEKEFLPESTPVWRPSEAIQNEDYDKLLGVEGERAGDIIPAAAGMIPAAAVAGGSPVATIGVQSIAENENPIENISAGKILQTGAKYGPKIIENTPGAIGKSIGAVKAGAEAAMPARYSQRKTLNKAADIVNETIADITKDYNTALQDPRLPATVDVKLDPSLVADFKKGAPGFSVNVDKALETKSLQDLHKAATDLGDYSRNVKERKTKASPKVQQNAINADKLKAQIEKIIDDTLDTQPGLKDTYRVADQKYKAYKESVPKTLEQVLRKYQEGKLLEKDAARAFKAKDAAEFRKKYMAELPGIETATNQTSAANIPGVRHGLNVLQKILGDKR